MDWLEQDPKKNPKIKKSNKRLNAFFMVEVFCVLLHQPFEKSVTPFSKVYP